MTQVKVSKWGNSIGVRFPKTVAEAMRLRDGDLVDISVNNGKATLEKRSTLLAPTLVEMISEMDQMGWANEPKTVDWGRDVGSERVQDDE
jgi:antitoxin MazE